MFPGIPTLLSSPTSLLYFPNTIYIPFFPGPINNYSITLFKDFWYDSLKIDSQENYFIKEGLEINKDYYLINKENWDFLDKFFYSTNELIRRGNNNDLISLKCLIFHEKLNILKKLNHYYFLF